MHTKNEFLLHGHLRINLITTFLFLFYFIDILVYFHDALLQCAQQLFINLSLHYICAIILFRTHYLHHTCYNMWAIIFIMAQTLKGLFGEKQLVTVIIFFCATISKRNGVVIKSLRNNFVLVKNCCACQFKDMQKCWVIFINLQHN